jgi:hypothetical protein
VIRQQNSNVGLFIRLGRVTPTAENYFNRVSKLQILEALQEARLQPPAPAWANLKKAELAALAVRETAATGLLPLPLRQSP